MRLMTSYLVDFQPFGIDCTPDGGKGYTEDKSED
jgi:hypothetical protein